MCPGPQRPADHYGARMRHLGTLIAAVVIAPLAWILIAFGQDRSATAFANAHSGALHGGDFVRPLQYLAAAGLLLGLIATLRFSPLGALVAGAGYLSSYALLVVAPDQLLRFFSHDLSVVGHRADLATPVRTGTTLLVGALLVVAAASIGRWRRWPRPAADRFDTDPAVDRPVGADGLGLLPPGRGGEPEFAVRYGTGPEPAMSGGPRSRFTAPPGDEFGRTHW
jgi:hypothetical protein